jgi:hypothetical protein
MGFLKAPAPCVLGLSFYLRCKKLRQWIVYPQQSAVLFVSTVVIKI